MPATAAPNPAQAARHTARRALLAAGLGALALAGGLWAAPAVRGAWPRPKAPALEPDVCLVAPPSAYDPASGLPPEAARAVPPGARCPVCGMYPARAPQWAAQLIFRNGDAHFFDSPLSLFMYLHDMARYSPGRSAGDVAALYVTDSAQPATPAWTPARQAFYVHGSNAVGPMRAGNLPGFADRGAAQRFAAQRGGQVLEFARIDAALVAALAGHGGHAGH